MSRTVDYIVYLSLSTCLLFSACSESVITDYREAWIGTYEGTKSNTSFDDTVFATPITFEVVIDETSTDGLIINGINFPISEAGTYGPDFLEGGFTNYELSISDGALRLHSFNSLVPGIFLPCFISATQQ
jgi:hypothetical protein